MGLKPINELPKDVSDKEHYGYIDNLGYKYSLTINQIKCVNYGHAIVKSSNPYSIENINNYIKINNGRCILLTEKWVNAKTKLKLKCGKCGKEYEVIWYHLYSNKKFTCNKCSKEIPPNRINQDDTEKICRKHGYHIIDGTYISRKKFDIIDKDGYKYSDCSVYTLDKRSNRYKKFENKNKYQIENMKLYINKNNIPMIIMDNQCNVQTNEYLKVYCSECGDIFDVRWDNVYRVYFSCRCRKCTKSKSNLEYIVEQYLIERNVKYVWQKKFSWCRKKKELPFDFYLEDYNCVIEVNGGQHYYENKIFKQPLEEIQLIDKFKKDCCIKKWSQIRRNSVLGNNSIQD